MKNMGMHWVKMRWTRFEALDFGEQFAFEETLGLLSYLKVQTKKGPAAIRTSDFFLEKTNIDPQTKVLVVTSVASS